MTTYGSLEIKKGRSGSEEDGSPLPPASSGGGKGGRTKKKGTKAVEFGATGANGGGGRTAASSSRGSFARRSQIRQKMKKAGGAASSSRRITDHPEQRGSVLSTMMTSTRAAEGFKTAARRRRAQERRRLDGAAADDHEKGTGAYSLLVGGSSPTSSSRSAAAPSCSSNHSWLYTLLNPRSHQPHAIFFKRFIAVVICVDLVFFVCSTEPAWEDHPIFYYAEGVASSIFLVEYLARLISCTESTRFKPHGPVMGRIRFMLTFPSIIDALATFPFFVERFFPVELPTTTPLRIFRLLRLLKTEGFAKAFDSVTRVIYYNSEILNVAAILVVFLVLVTAVAMYYLRPQADHTGLIESDFSSILATMYLTTLMLTGQGGPSGDLPWYTQAIVLLTGIFSVAMFAIPASMLTWGFEAEAERLAVKARKRKLHESQRSSRRNLGVDSDTTESSESDAYASSSSMDTSDEEYQKIIGGYEEEDDLAENEGDPEKKAALQEILGMFTMADDDGSGTLTKQEFVKMVEPLLEAAAAGPASFTAGQQQSGGAGGASLAATVGATPGATASTAMTGAPSEVIVLSTRVARLEAKVDALTGKLDRLIHMSETPADRAVRPDPFP